jgi:endonuclease YncB( thermonuclease family)
MASSYVYEATVARVLDGDTVHLNVRKTFTFDVDFGFGIKDTVSFTKSAEIDVRLKGINAPEIHGPTQEAGLRSKQELELLLRLGAITVTTYKTDKYGRWLGEIVVTMAGGTKININQEMVRTGFATNYDGEGPKS